MKYLIIILFFLTLTFESMTQTNSTDIKKIVEEIKIKFAPDSRTAIFNISAELNKKEVKLTGETNIPDAKKELLANLQKFEITDSVLTLPAAELGSKIYGIANLSVANIRTKPDHAAELATQVLLGTNLIILKSFHGWYLVQCEDDYIGWVDDDGIFPVDETEKDEWQTSQKIIVTSPFTLCYLQNDLSSSPVSDLVAGDILKFISSDNNFTLVEFPDNRKAFIQNEKVQEFENWLDSQNPTFEKIEQTAKLMMGVPYLWGGTSIKGMDCSGFTKTVFMLNGVQLPRDASQQVSVGELIDLQNGFDDLQPGDLLFFGRIDHISGKERITHVAIYLGNLEFIHASGRVRINSFDKSKNNFAESRFKGFMKAKRILTSLGKNGVKLIKDLK